MLRKSNRCATELSEFYEMCCINATTIFILVIDLTINGLQAVSYSRQMVNEITLKVFHVYNKLLNR